MIIAVLTFGFLWSLFYGQVPQPYMLMICAGPSIALAVIRKHGHTQALSIDVMAQWSRLKKINPDLKFWTLLILILICVASASPATGVFLAVAALLLAVFAGGHRLHHYIHLLALPVSFLLIGGFALLFDISDGPAGVLSIEAFGAWLNVSTAAQARTTLIISRAFGAVSCLTLLSVSTPMPDIIGVLHRARCPDVIIDIMYLIYRYIFILMSLHHDMAAAAKSRLGFRDYRSGLRATGKIYANLLARSYHFASKNFDSMESRCYDTGIRFLHRRCKVALPHAATSAALVSISLLLTL